MEYKKSYNCLSKIRGFSLVKYSLFSYKAGSSFLHKCPAWCKILFIPLINILFLCLPPIFSFILLVIQFILALILGFSLREQFTDVKPVFYYAFLLFLFQIISWLFSNPGLESFKTQFSWDSEKESVFLLIKLFSIMQSASLVFKTSTSLELRDGIGKIFGQKSVLTNALSLFLNFIPMVSKIWEESKKAWLARGGKKNLKMYFVLLPVLFSIGLKKAYNVARAILIRN